MTKKFNALAAAAALTQNAPNMQEAQKGGGDYQPPPEGVAMLRLVAYVELGKKREEYQGQVKIRDKVQLTFELHGKNYPVKEVEGVGKVPMRINVTESISLNEKANFFKLFNMMRNGRQHITHMAQMLGEGFKGRITHSTGKKDPSKVFAKLRNESGYQISAPTREDPETGEAVALKVPAAISELRLFIWDAADKDQWDSLFIDGEYEEGKTKNVYQKQIREALNFVGSPIHAILSGADDLASDDDVGGDDLDNDGDHDDDVQDAPPSNVKPTTKAKPAAKAKKEAKPATTAAADDSALDGLDEDIPF